MTIREKTLTDLIKKYNVAGPRYTSYPTALHLTDRFERAELQNMLSRRALSPKALSLYFHIPFCFSLCWYCGCTKIITRDQDRGDVYLEYLDKEAALISETIHPESVVEQIHFGGGTPTFLNPDQLLNLGEIIRRYFNISEQVEFSVEIDPRRCTRNHIDALRQIGMNRASLGVQDTNSEVQQAIHRIQPVELTAEITNLLRESGIGSINYDLIYGLPRQTPETFSKTIEDVTALSPERYAIYSYAHLPSVMPSQKLLNEDEFPTTAEKLSMLVYSIETLPEYGYRYIGMDHFAKEEDELSHAMDVGTLHRNFQGYSTHAELEMIALGMSGISQGEDLYYQNEKDLGKYYKALDEKRIPVAKIIKLSNEDKLRKKIIMDIMCSGEMDYSIYEGVSGEKVRTIFDQNRPLLDELEQDGLLTYNRQGFRLTGRGRLFLRNAAMVFDGYINNSESVAGRTYSKTV